MTSSARSLLGGWGQQSVSDLRTVPEAVPVTCYEWVLGVAT